MDLHFKKDGTLDMRYASSKQAVSSGLYDQSGRAIGGSGGSSGFSAPSYGSQSYQSSPSCPASPAPSVSVSNAPVYNAKRIDPDLRTIGQTKHGSKADGTDGCHIISHEVLNTVLSHMPGRNFSDRVQEHIAREINSDTNIRIKSRDGNMYGKDGYSGDRYYDGQIINALNSSDKILTNQGSVDRLRRQWEMVQKLDLPPSLKQGFRDQFSQIKDQNGNSIVRANAPIDGYT